MNIKESFITWCSLIYNLPCSILQFVINASIDTLATNANLKRWGKRGNSKWELCGGRETILHLLNHCKAMLDRYLWLHNSILSCLYTLSLSGNITDNIIYSDLSNANMPVISTIQIYITITTQRPDLVIVNRINSTITILELSVPFKPNISDTHNRKLNRYANLIADIESKNFKVNYYALEICSRGYISPENQNRLKHFIKGLHINNKYSQSH